MITWKTWGIVAVTAGSLLFANSISEENTRHEHSIGEDIICSSPQGCVFRTLFGEEYSNVSQGINSTEAVDKSLTDGLSWIVKAQHENGGWGAGSHGRQDILDPHAVQPDPATTAMVAMALLRTGSRLDGDQYSEQLQGALEFLLHEVESTPANRMTITAETGTQIQTKLGVNIDAVLTMQFLSNLIDYLDKDSEEYARVMSALNTCASKVQALQDSDGSTQGSGWAGVLQSSLANNALETAQFYGAEVDEDVLEKSREYQKNNYDSKSGSVNTSRGAGVVLYSVSGSARASAKEARRVRNAVNEAKDQGIVAQDAEVSHEVLAELGYTEEEALKYMTAYEVYEGSKNTAQNDEVMTGFGNNGGEEFLSYLQTGESLLVNDDADWKSWYDSMANRLVSIQNQDGSWSGHHCITSPVFCTATTLMILSIMEDRARLMELGNE